MQHLDEIKEEAFVDELQKIAKGDDGKKSSGHGSAIGAGIVGGLGADLILAPITAPINEYVMKGYKKAIPAVKNFFTKR